MKDICVKHANMQHMLLVGKTHGMAGNGKASVAGAEGTVSSGRSDRRNGSGDLGGKAKVLDGGKGCKQEIEEWKIYKNQCS